MFPITVSFTINNAEQLSKLGKLMDGVETAPKSAPAEKAASGKTIAKDTAAPTKTDAAPTPTAPSAEAAPQASTAADPKPAAEVSAPATPAASTASSAEPVSFDVLKKAFLSLSTKEGGRAKCESVLKPFALGKLSEAKEDQYAALLDAINQASA